MLDLIVEYLIHLAFVSLVFYSGARWERNKH